ncbi:MAG: TonB family protein [Terriglobales bacterium]
MSAATAPALEKIRQRNFPRHPIKVPVDLIALRFGVPENLPGRCTDISEVGVGAVVSGEMAAGQQVAVELRLPNVGVPMRARALVRYQSRFRCGLEFVGLSAEQRSMIRYWARCYAPQPATNSASVPASVDPASVNPANVNDDSAQTEEPIAVVEPAAKPKRRIRIGRRGLIVLIAAVLAVAGLGWWQWQTSWNELEGQNLAGEQLLRLSQETMENRIVKKVDPVYPEAARTAGIEGVVVLDAVIGPDGSVRLLRTVSGPRLLVQSATDAVQYWKFEPYLTSGKAVDVETTIAVEFRLH